MKEEKIILSIEVLTSRKEDQVRRCLASLEPLRKAIPCELIVVDTSEDEHMGQVVREYADKVVPFHWIQDFSAARNVGLKEARGEWFMFLDDDEWFVDLQEMIDFFKSGEYREYEGATYVQRNFINRVGTLWDDDWVSRMIRLDPETHFESPIHEYFEPAPHTSKGVRAIVNHYGYVFVSEEQKLAHFERNYGLIKDMMTKQPDEPRWRMQMMLELNSVNRFEELIELGEACLKDFDQTTNLQAINAFSSFYAARQTGYHGLKDYESAYGVCKEALQDPRVSKMGIAYFHFCKGEYELDRRQFRQAEKDELTLLDFYGYFQENEAERIMLGGVPFIMQTFMEYNMMKAYSVLICAGLYQRNPKYLKRYFAKLKLDGLTHYLHPGLPRALIEGMVGIDSDKLFVKTLQTLTKNEEVWQKFELALLDYAMEEKRGISKLIRLLRQAGIQSAFMELYPLRQQLAEHTDEYTDEKLIGELKRYTKLSLDYYGGIYHEKDDAKSKETGEEEGREPTSAEAEKASAEEKPETELPPDYKAALRLDELFNADERDQIPLVKGVVEAYPPFSEAMKRYAEYLGKQMEGEESAPAANPELEQMARQVLDSVRTMLDGGMYGEALQVIGQLKGMLPGNREIEELEVQITEKMS